MEGLLGPTFQGHASSTLLKGPSVGSLFYSAGGFGLPFYAVGSIGVVLAAILLVIIPDVRKEEDRKRGGIFSLCRRSRKGEEEADAGYYRTT